MMRCERVSEVYNGHMASGAMNGSMQIYAFVLRREDAAASRIVYH